MRVALSCSTASAHDPMFEIYCIFTVFHAGDHDYSQLTVHLTFNAGSQAGSTACTDISIINDTILESDEYFTITLSSSDPVNFDVSMGSCTIIEDADSKLEILMDLFTMWYAV